MLWAGSHYSEVVSNLECTTVVLFNELGTANLTLRDFQIFTQMSLNIFHFIKEIEDKDNFEIKSVLYREACSILLTIPCCSQTFLGSVHQKYVSQHNVLSWILAHFLTLF